ncbi:MAG: hypothetical protein EPO20_29070 [Betaproteobacteria bacterium]|nr:MAG: hypothetical protein EPO20_29070 [Betaproteobacteria bacterium]
MAPLAALILSLPTHNSTMRMRVWRALKDAGCGALRDGVYVLPSEAAVLAEVEKQVKSAGGFAMCVELTLKSDAQLAHVRTLFGRGADYGALVRKMKEAKDSLKRLGPRKARTAVERLQRSFDALCAIDFFPGPAKGQAADAMAALRRDLHQAYSRGEPRPSRRRLTPVNRAKYQKRLWATRKDLWVDRLAAAWLIKRFIDPAARFAWIDRPSERPKKAVGFDFDGAEFTHVKNRVTFEVLLDTFGLDHDPALASIGSAVHFLDIGGIPVPDAKGLETVLRGIKEKTRSDDALLAEAMRIFDHFYSAYGQAPRAD